jgi:hypothetical protein
VAGDAERLEMLPVAGEQHQVVSAGGCRDGDVGEARMSSGRMRCRCRPMTASSQWLRRSARSVPPARLSLQIPCSISATVMVEM